MNLVFFASFCLGLKVLRGFVFAPADPGDATVEIRDAVNTDH